MSRTEESHRKSRNPRPKAEVNPRPKAAPRRKGSPLYICSIGALSLRGIWGTWGSQGNPPENSLSESLFLDPGVVSEGFGMWGSGVGLGYGCWVRGRRGASEPSTRNGLHSTVHFGKSPFPMPQHPQATPIRALGDSAGLMDPSLSPLVEPRRGVRALA